MKIDPKEHKSAAIYRLLTSVVVPRPIAWVSTKAKDGVLNLAPFSYFNAVTSRPPLLSISAGRRKGERKDTTRNASTTGELVVNIVDEENLAKMVETSGEYPPEVDEFERASLTPLKSVLVEPPRVAEAPIQMECRTREIFEISPGVADLIIAEVVMFHVSDSLGISDELVVPAERLKAVGRLGGNDYTLLGEKRSLPRP